MKKTVVLVFTGALAILYAINEVTRYDIYSPDDRLQVLTGWEVAISLWHVILALAVGAMTISLSLFISYFRGSESRRIQSEINEYQQALMDAEKAHTARQNTLIQNHNLEIAALRSHCSSAEDVLREEFEEKEKRWRQALQNAREEARQELEEQTEALNQRASGLLVQEQTLKARMAEVRKYVAGERHNAMRARLEAEEAEKRRQNASATAERRRRKLEKLQATDGTAGQKH
ncbi:hypothetical protein ACNHQI_27190 [Klebsiella quasipneumoniae]|uniref:hypothetical protein n=1 Tax=Klebsiella quasipneumoniae TaxID=1463165 RepID=UPI003A80520A